MSQREQPRKIANLAEYVCNRAIHQAAGWSNGKVYYQGKNYTQEEFNKIYPVELKYSVLQLDGTQIKNN